MSKHFEEARLVITADVVYDPDSIDITVLNYLKKRVEEILNMHHVLNKNINAELKGFICEK